MFGLIEKKIERILKSEKETINKLKREQKKIEEELANLEQNLEIFDDRKNHKINIIIEILLGCGIITSSILFPALPNILFIISSLFCGAALLNDIDSLKSTKQYLSYDNIGISKDDHIQLIEKYNKLNNKFNAINYQIKVKESDIDEYTQISGKIDELKIYKNSLNANSKELEKASDYFSKQPEYVFDTEEEYAVYKSYNDEFIKKELVKTKLLEKKNNKK